MTKRTVRREVSAIADDSMKSFSMLTEGLTSTEALPETDTLDGWTLLEKLGEGCACLSSRLRSVAS